MTQFGIAVLTPYLLPLQIGLPLLAAVAVFLAPTPKQRHWLSLGFATLQLALASKIFITIKHTAISDGLRYHLAGWQSPLGIDLYADGLTAILLLTSAVLVLMLSVYSISYFKESEQSRRFWPLWWLLIAGLNGAFISGDAFNIYVTLEMIGLASVALIALAGTRTALVAALRYVMVSLVASLLYLMGIALLYRAYGTLDLLQLSQLVQADGLSWAALALISVGLLLKTALLPLHFWLPAAHSSAPAPVSAILSALVVKASFYLLVRFWLEVLSPAVTEFGLMLLGFMGGCAIIGGCIAALFVKRLKLLVAYSTVAQLGYLFLLFPLTMMNNPNINPNTMGLTDSAIAAITYFIVVHALAKAAMFLAVGNVIKGYGHDELDGLKGLIHFQPLTLLTFAIAGISLIGLPPSGGFIAKWLLLKAAINTGQWWWVMIIVTGGLLAAAYIFKVLNLAFAKAETPNGTTIHANPHFIPHGMTASGLLLACATLLLGFSAEWLLNMSNSNITNILANGG